MLCISYAFIPALIDVMHYADGLQSQRYSTIRKIVKARRLYHKIIESILRYRKLAIVCVVLLFGLPVFMLPVQIKDWDVYNRTLGNEWYVDNVRPHVNKWLGGTLRLFARYVYDGGSFRKNEETKLYVDVRMPLGTTMMQMDDMMRKLELYMSQFEGRVNTYITRIQNGEVAFMEITFNTSGSASFPFQLKNRVQSFAIDQGGAEWNVYGVGKAFSNAGGAQIPRFQVLFKGYNDEMLKLLTHQFADTLELHPRIKEVDREGNIEWWIRDLYAFNVAMDLDAMYDQGVNIGHVMDLLQMYNQESTTIRYSQDNVPIRLANAKRENYDLWRLNNTTDNVDSIPVSLASMIHIEKEKVQSSIHKEDQQYLKLIEWEYTGSGRFGQKYLDEKMKYFQKQLPLGFSMQQQNSGYWNDEKQKQFLLMGLVVVLIFFICSIHFESLRLALSIIFLIPLSFIGIFITFYFFDISFDQGGYTSFILTSGIVVNGLILIISDYIRINKKYPMRRDLHNYVKAVGGKITPLGITVVSTVVGLVPFMIHGNQEVFWFALAAGTIGGLVFSCIVLLFFIPLFMRWDEV